MLNRSEFAWQRPKPRVQTDWLQFPREWDLKDPLWLYLGGQGDLVSRLIMGINGVTIWVIGVINLLTKSP